MTGATGVRVTARRFVAGLDRLGYDFFTGVPCSSLGPLYAVPGLAARYRPATREDLAVGLAAGAALAGARPAVLMQNSGLGLIQTALLTLQRMYDLPVLLVIGWRGHGPDAPEHVEMGRLTPGLLTSLGVPHRLAVEPDAMEPAFHSTRGPVALLVRPGDLGA
jgi:sulfopyruvate decarboxylase TPP-binding subunit